MDSGNNTLEIQEGAVQPDKVVVTESEVTEAKPQAEASEQEEFYIEEEADQQQANTSMTKEQSYAAFRKEKEKRQRKNDQLEAEKAEREKIQRELDELKATVGSIKKGSPPKFYDFDDEDVYEAAVKEYYSAPQAKPKAKAQEETQAPSNDEADFYLYQREQDLTEKMPQYNEAKQGFINKLKSQYNEPNADNALAFLSEIARHKKVDIAKAIAAMNQVPSLIGDLYSANNNAIVIGDILEKAAKKVKVRSHKSIDTKPEPEINNSGPIDNATGTIAKLRAEWVKDSSNTAKYDAYMNAKKQKVN